MLRILPRSLPWRAIPALLLLLAPCLAAARALEEPDGVVLNVTVSDLLRLVRGALELDEAGRFSGEGNPGSNGVSGLSYQGDVSPPVLRLDQEGGAVIDLAILEARVEVDRLERRFMSRDAFCENAAVVVDPERPVELSLALRMRAEGGGLRIWPESFDLTSEAFRLVKPSRCGNVLLPKWLLWWVGKPHLRRYLADLDEILLERLREQAEELDEEGGLLHHEWHGLQFGPRGVDTRRGTVFVSFGAPEAQIGSEPRGALAWSGPLAERSFIGLSESFANTVLGAAFADVPQGEHRPNGDVGGIFRSEAVDALIPGLAGVESREGLFVTFRFRTPPRVEFTRTVGAHPGPDGDAVRQRAAVRILLRGIELNLRQETEDGDRLLGALTIESATLDAVPFEGPLGGISFELVRNDWTLISSGIEFDEELMAAALQELVFSEAFGTRYEPVRPEGIQVGRTEFQPRFFDVVGDYLVIGLAGTLR